MTGFGEASHQVEGTHYLLEVRSLNNRYFKATVRLPEELASLEAELETKLRKRFTRGSITLMVKMRLSDAFDVQQVNDQALISYLNHLETIHKRAAEGDRSVQIDLTALLALPGVLKPREDEFSLISVAKPILERLFKDACDKMQDMRQREGDVIAADLQHHNKIIADHLADIQSRTGQVVEEYHARLRSRVDELLARAQLELNQTDLVREVAVFAERSDISEELSRLSGHIEQFERMIADTEDKPIGRTMDFLAQEMLREANTIASKSNDGQISRAIVEVKGAIDRIKEQVQNIE